jgi:hypothetical protein
MSFQFGGIAFQGKLPMQAIQQMNIVTPVDDECSC